MGITDRQPMVMATTTDLDAAVARHAAEPLQLQVVEIPRQVEDCRKELADAGRTKDAEAARPEQIIPRPARQAAEFQRVWRRRDTLDERVKRAHGRAAAAPLLRTCVWKGGALLALCGVGVVFVLVLPGDAWLAGWPAMPAHAPGWMCAGGSNGWVRGGAAEVCALARERGMASYCSWRMACVACISVCLLSSNEKGAFKLHAWVIQGAGHWVDGPARRGAWPVRVCHLVIACTAAFPTVPAQSPAQ